MESQVLSIEQEARRVAAALGVEAWERHGADNIGSFDFVSQGLPYSVEWFFHYGELVIIDVGSVFEGWCRVSRFLKNGEGWDVELNSPSFDEIMALGLYRLGFEDAAVLSQLPELSAHQQIEARLSLPREFWPVQWLEELKP